MATTVMLSTTLDDWYSSGAEEVPSCVKTVSVYCVPMANGAASVSVAVALTKLDPGTVTSVMDVALTVSLPVLRMASICTPCPSALIRAWMFNSTDVASAVSAPATLALIHF